MKESVVQRCVMFDSALHASVRFCSQVCNVTRGAYLSDALGSYMHKGRPADYSSKVV